VIIASARISRFERQGDLTPSGAGVGAELAMIGGSHVFSMKMEKIGNLAVD
jgi:hypothetical protein